MGWKVWGMPVEILEMARKRGKAYMEQKMYEMKWDT